MFYFFIKIRTFEFKNIMNKVLPEPDHSQ